MCVKVRVYMCCFSFIRENECRIAAYDLNWLGKRHLKSTFFK